MSRTTTTVWMLSLLLAFVASAAFAETSKLDARARIAVAELRSGIAPAQVRLEGASVSATGDLDVFIRGSVSRSQLEAFGVQVRTELPGLFTAFVPLGAIDQVAALDGVTSIRGAVLAEPNLDASVPTTGANLLRGAGPAFAGLNGNGVLIGDVDSGIDIHHGDFKDAGGLTRILNIWDQTVVGTPPAGYSAGTEWTKAQIDGGTCTETDPGAIASGGGHGTHVMGIAAGDGSQTGGAIPAFTYVGMAPMADIVEVKTDFFTSSIVDGVAYVMGRAAALGKQAVVNLSLGSQFGPHDGTSDFESGLTALTGPGQVVVVSAGNDRGSNKHAQTLAAGAGSNITLAVSGSANNRLLAIDGYYNGTETINVRITAPNGTVIGPLALGAVNGAYPGVTYTGAGRVYVENGVFTTPAGAREVYVELTGLTGNSINGTWTLTFIPVTLGAANGEVDLWRYYVSSSALVANFATGMTNSELVSEPGNATGVITVAAWETKNSWFDCGGRSVSYSSPAPLGAIATFSSPGPTRDGRQKPDLAAPGMGIGSTRSFDATGTCGATASALLNDGSNHVINQGTSMAAPHVAGATALLMQKYGALTPAEVRAYLFTHAVIDGNTGTVWNADFGNGKLWLGDLVDPSVAVLFPNGGENLLIGGGTILGWTATDNVGVTLVDLYLSRSGVGGPWETIALGVPNSGSYPWNATGPGTTHAIFKVVAHDAEANLGEDVSDAEFTLYDGATGTLMSLFEMNARDRGIELRWQFGDPTAWSAVTVERAPSATGPWQAIAAQQRIEGTFAIALDADVVVGQTYWYRLNAQRASGGSATFGPISGTAGERILDFSLSKIAPNPTSGMARIEYAVPRSTNVKVAVLDVQGREVAMLRNGVHPAGRYQTVWTGEISGHRALAGVYFIRLQSTGHELTRRVVVQQ